MNKEDFKMIETLEAKEAQLKELVPIYKDAYRRHNVFDKPDKYILNYLKEQHKKNWREGGGFVVGIYNDPLKNIERVAGGALLSLEGKSSDLHTLWKIKHVAVDRRYRGKGIGAEIMKEAFEKIRSMIDIRKISSAKIEVSVSENEKKAIKFYKKLGFKIEGKLSNHYRNKEMCYILGRSIKP